MSGSDYDHGAPWNEGEDGECWCARCRARAAKEGRREQEIEDRYGDGGYTLPPE